MTDLQAYAKENLFNYGTLDFQDSAMELKHHLEGKGLPAQKKNLCIIVPNRNEKPYKFGETIKTLCQSNIYTNRVLGIGEEEFMAKGIVVYYSRTGNTTEMAQVIAESMN